MGKIFFINSNSIYKYIMASKNSIVDPLLNPPHKFHVDSKGTIYVPLQEANKIIAFDHTGKRVTFGNGSDAIEIDAPYAVYGNVALEPVDNIVVDADILYVLHRVNGIYKVDKKRGEVLGLLIKMDSYFQDPISASVIDDFIFVALYKNDVLADITSKICVYHRVTGKMITYIESCTLPIALPQCVVCDNGQNGDGTDRDRIIFFVANNGRNLSKFEFGRKSGNIRQLEYTTDKSDIIYDDHMKIRDFAIDNWDNIYVSSNGLNFVSVFNSDGVFLKHIGFGGCVPKHLFIRDGFIYFTNVRGDGEKMGIYVYDLNGKPVALATNTSSIVEKDTTITIDMKVPNILPGVPTPPSKPIVAKKALGSEMVHFDNAIQYVSQNIDLYHQLIDLDGTMKSELQKPKSAVSHRLSATLFDYSADSESSILITPNIFYILVNGLDKLPLGHPKIQAFVKKYNIKSGDLAEMMKEIQDNTGLYKLFLEHYQEALFYKFNLKGKFESVMSGKVKSGMVSIYLAKSVFEKIEFEHKNYSAKDLSALLA